MKLLVLFIPWPEILFYIVFCLLICYVLHVIFRSLFPIKTKVHEIIKILELKNYKVKRHIRYDGKREEYLLKLPEKTPDKSISRQDFINDIAEHYKRKDLDFKYEKDTDEFEVRTTDKRALWAFTLIYYQGHEGLLTIRRIG